MVIFPEGYHSSCHVHVQFSIHYSISFMAGVDKTKSYLIIEKCDIKEVNKNNLLKMSLEADRELKLLEF